MTTNVSVSITNQAQKRLEEQSRLSPNAIKRFRTRIHRIISGQVCADQIKKMHGHECLFRIRYNRFLRIIATVVKTEQVNHFRILDFVSHDEMDRNQIVMDAIEFYDFSIDDELDADQEINSSLRFICSDRRLQIDLSDFKAQRDDFYLHITDPENTQDPDLWLSSDQNELVNKQLPILLSGSAGSGKTTILIYHALKKSFEIAATHNRVLYVTYNKFLKKEAERIAKEVCPNLPENLEFCSYLDLLRSYYVDTNQFNEVAEVNQKRFMNEFYKTRSKDFQGIDPILVWQEIRNLIKGSLFVIEEGRKLLTPDEYHNRRNESSLIDWSLYHQVYSLAQKYQIWIESKNYWDEIDITQNALANISNSLKEESKYTAIYCDEIQDLTKNQISLLLNLLQKSYYNLPDFFFTGDPAQIINPSGFSWKKVKDLIYNLYNNLPKSQSIQNDKLDLNFRSTESIVKLGRKILESNDINTCELLFQEAYKKDGETPLVITLSEPNILRDNDDFGSRNAIIVANEQEKNKLRKQFSKDGTESERIFLFTEVKGLEFDEVLVWKFFEYFNNWRTDSKELQKFKFNLLYVCTTRARERLFFYEGENINVFWQNIAIKPCVSITNDYQRITRFFKNDETEEQKIESAKEYERIGKYEIAKELYSRCNRRDDVNRVDALICEEAKEFERAAEYWGRLQNHTRQALCFEKLTNFEKAAYCYAKLENWNDAERCWRKVLNWEKVVFACQKQEKWREAAEAFEELNNFESAARCYAKLENWNDAERCWRKVLNWEKVVFACQKQEKWREAAEAFEELNNFESAARCYAKLENWSDAERCWREVSNWKNIALVCQKQEKWREASEVWEKLQNYAKQAFCLEQIGDFENAACCYAKIQNWCDTERCWREVSNWKNIALVCQQQEKWGDAAEAWGRLQNSTNQAFCLEKASSFYARVQNLGEAERYWQELVNLYEKNEMWERLEQVLLTIYENREWAKISTDEGRKLAIVQEKIEKLVKAAISWEIYARDPYKAIDTWIRLRNIEQISRIAKKITDPDQRDFYELIASLIAYNAPF